TKEFVKDSEGKLAGLKINEVVWDKDLITGKYTFTEVDGTEKILPCGAAFLAIGFLHGDPKGIMAQLGVDLDERGNVQANNYQTSVPKVFAAGDMRRGQSLVVWAISEGREAAKVADEFLMGERSLLDTKEKSLYAI
ncbi:MAG TPA: FAD-dependent oxidoreductase, partial [Saprospiraceae bacterium]|nr:FAD-dependent oxidoreductase [Saprospiraceae bacterium]